MTGLSEKDRAMVEAIKGEMRALLQAARSEGQGPPVAMILHCPACGVQHLDEPDEVSGWTNPPHRSHLCFACGHIWRPADVPTNGVAAIKTKGAADSPFPPNPQARIEALEGERDQLREIVRRYGDRERMATAAPPGLQEVIDAAFAAALNPQATDQAATKGVEHGGS